MTKILILSDFFPPAKNAGGPTKSIYLLAKSLSSKNEILILTNARDKGSRSLMKGIEDGKIKNFRTFKVLYFIKPLTKFFYIIRVYRPDCLWLNSFFSLTSIAILIFNKFGLIKIPIILSPRGELLDGALNIKRLKKYIYLRATEILGFYDGINFHVTSSSENHSIKLNFKKFNNVYLIQNLIQNIKCLPLTKNNKTLKIIFLSRVCKKKNLLFALEILSNIKNINIVFDIYGPIEDFDYWSYCLSLIKIMPSNIKVSYKGLVEQKKVFSCMRKYHIFFLPTESENFGHVIVEAMQAGLIPIISDKTPWKKLHTINSGWAIPLKNRSAFLKAIKDASKLTTTNFSENSLNCIKYIKFRCNNNNAIAQYNKMLLDIIDNS